MLLKITLHLSLLFSSSSAFSFFLHPTDRLVSFLRSKINPSPVQGRGRWRQRAELGHRQRPYISDSAGQRSSLRIYCRSSLLPVFDQSNIMIPACRSISNTVHFITNIRRAAQISQNQVMLQVTVRVYGQTIVWGPPSGNGALSIHLVCL